MGDNIFGGLRLGWISLNIVVLVIALKEHIIIVTKEPVLPLQFRQNNNLSFSQLCVIFSLFNELPKRKAILIKEFAKIDKPIEEFSAEIK